ncbi:MAG: FadR family transcriptional regulator [Rhodospirillaceae bacterium]|nr:FadR family transcriptional regulator [Rhodospirillaceae bacterium]
MATEQIGQTRTDWSDQNARLAPSAGRTSSPVSQVAVQTIQGMILSGALAANQRLPSERQLAAQLGVSRSSLREALSILQALGMVRVESGKGTFVIGPGGTGATPPVEWRFSSRYTLREVYQFRLFAESAAARLAAMTITDAQSIALHQILEDFKAAIRRMDLVTTSQKDFELHQRIMELSQNRLLADLHGTYRNIFLESQRLPMARPNQRWEPAAEHERVVEAITMHDPDGAAYYMRVHLMRAAERTGVTLTDLP